MKLPLVLSLFFHSPLLSRPSSRKAWKSALALSTIVGGGAIIAPAQATETEITGPTTITTGGDYVVRGNVTDSYYDAVTVNSGVTVGNFTIMPGGALIETDNDSLFNYGIIQNLIHDGTINANNHGIHNSGIIDHLINRGSLRGNNADIINSNILTTLTNAQQNLIYSRNLPATYETYFMNGTYGTIAFRNLSNVNAAMSYGLQGDYQVGEYPGVMTFDEDRTAPITTVSIDGVTYVLTSRSNGRTWDLTITQVPVESTFAEGFSPNDAAYEAARVLDDTPALQHLFSSLSTDKERSDAVSQTLPSLATGAPLMMLTGVVTAASQIIQDRQDSPLPLFPLLGTKHHYWVKPFGTWGSQGADGSIPGVRSQTGGLVAGMEGILQNQGRLGLAFTYADTRMDQDTTRADLKTTSYLITAYGQSPLFGSSAGGSPWELNVQLNGGVHQTQSRRSLQFTGFNKTATAQYEGYNLHIHTGIGHPLTLHPRTILTPSMELMYHLMFNNGYTEEGADGLSLRVHSQKTEQLTPTMGTKLSHSLAQGFVITASAHLGYDLFNQEGVVTSQYSGGGRSFQTEGIKFSPWMVRSHVGVTYHWPKSYDVGLSYDRQDRAGGLTAQTASLTYKWVF